MYQSQFSHYMDYDEDELVHFGVKGMHWGVRKKRDGGGSGKPAKVKRAAPSDQVIKEARRRLEGEKHKYGTLEDKMTYGKNADAKTNKATEKKMSQMNADLLKNPDRVTASYMTKGEKMVAGFGLIAGTVFATPVGVGVAAGVGANKVHRDLVRKDVERRGGKSQY